MSTSRRRRQCRLTASHCDGASATIDPTNATSKAARRGTGQEQDASVGARLPRCRRPKGAPDPMSIVLVARSQREWLHSRSLEIKTKHHVRRYAQPVTDEPFLTACCSLKRRCQSAGPRSSRQKPPGWSGTDSLRLGRGGQGVTSPGLSKGDHTRSGAYPAGAEDALRAVSKCWQRDGPDGSSVINPGAIASMTARMCSHCPQDTGNGPAKRNTPPPGSRMVNSKSHVVYLHAVPPANSRLTSVNSAYAEFGSAYPARASLMARYRFVV